MNHYESNYNQNTEYKKYKEYRLTNAWTAGHLADHLRNKSVLAKFTKAELVEILWNIEQYSLQEADLAQTGYRLKEIVNRKEGRDETF